MAQQGVTPDRIDEPVAAQGGHAVAERADAGQDDRVGAGHVVGGSGHLQRRRPDALKRLQDGLQVADAHVDDGDHAACPPAPTGRAAAKAGGRSIGANSNRTRPFSRNRPR